MSLSGQSLADIRDWKTFADRVPDVITPLLLSEVSLPDHHPRAGEACEVYGFVIHHSRGPIMVDTGVGKGEPEIDSLFSPVHHPIEDSFARVGVRLNEVRMIINSHLHFDHCGNNRLFPGVPLVVQLIEYEASQQAGYTVPDWINFPGADWKTVEGETELLPGLRVLPTPGHTPGHQSVLVEQADGTEVIAAQAVYDPDELDKEASTEPLHEVEAHQTSASARQIKAARPQRVLFSHSSRVWTPPLARD